jgi:methylated-DNA-protein-cysteine methyltransferase-like protein
VAETFHQKAVKICKRIPKGRVATYGMVATLAGSPRAARQVVRVLNVAWEKEGLPWHRLISREGRIALKPGQGFEMQKAMLKAEGVAVGPGGEIDLGKYLWKPRPKRN